jgi:uncharacterized surface protein with fasciclin (FAS1) repeats
MVAVVLVLNACAGPAQGFRPLPAETPEGQAAPEVEGEGTPAAGGEATAVPEETVSADGQATTTPVAETTPTPTPAPYTALDPEQGADIIVTAAALEDVDTLLGLIIQANLSDTLHGDGPFTLFAPTDAAFEALPEGALEALRANPETLREILLYHVAPGDLSASGLQAVAAVRSTQGDLLNVVADGESIQLNDSAAIIGPDVDTSNGTIHVINTVLLPPGTELPTGAAETQATAVPQEATASPATTPTEAAATSTTVPTEAEAEEAPPAASPTQEADAGAEVSPTAETPAEAEGAAAAPAEGASASDVETEFPLPAGATNVRLADDDIVDFRTSLSVAEVVSFYRQELEQMGLSEREGRTNIQESGFIMIFDGWPGRAGEGLIVQGVETGDGSTSVSIELREV